MSQAMNAFVALVMFLFDPIISSMDLSRPIPCDTAELAPANRYL